MDIEKLKELINKNYSTHKIALELKVSQSHICRTLKKHGLRTLAKPGPAPTINKIENSLRIKRTPEEKRLGNIKAVKKRRALVKQMSIQFLGGKCSKCGYSKCSSALEFHHINPNEKEFGIAYKGHTHSWERLKIELQKCVLVCANCHREIHEELLNK